MAGFPVVSGDMELPKTTEVTLKRLGMRVSTNNHRSPMVNCFRTIGIVFLSEQGKRETLCDSSNPATSTK